MTPAQYDAWYETPRGRWIGDTEYRILRALLDPRPDERVLDVGCGTGWFTRRLARDGVEATGLDTDRAALEFARAHAAAGERYLEGDACALPFADGAFDASVSVTALCFIADWPQAIAEMARVSRRRVVLGLLHRRSLLRLTKGRAGGQGGYAGAHWHTRAEIDGALAHVRLERVRYRYGVFLPSASTLAQACEQLMPTSVPFGSFMAVSGDIEEKRPRPAAWRS